MPQQLLDAAGLAELVRRRQASPLELVDAAIARVEKLNPQINAVVTPMFEHARELARGTLPDGPLRGVPFLLKDLLAAYAGFPSTAGSRLLADYVPDYDAEIVRRYKRAGLIVIGRTNTPEFGILPTTEPALFGKTRNPWNLERTVGGSSGGSAAAVASGMLPAAHASDGGGSIRIPAACCGLFGLKPTRARNPLGPSVGDSRSGLTAEHVVTRTVRDSAQLLDVTSGPDLGDPYWAPPPARPFVEEVGAPPGALRIAFSVRPTSGIPVHDDCVRAVHDAAKLCEELGHRVEEAAPDVGSPEALSGAFVTLWAAGVAERMFAGARLVGKDPKRDWVEPLTWAVAELGMRYAAHEYLAAVQHLQRVSRDVARFFVDYDAWITPTLREPPVLLGAFDSPPETPLLGFLHAGSFGCFTALQNVTGQPAANVPLYWNDEGLPIGVQFVARFGDEATLFRLASQLEQARPWASRCAPVFADAQA